MGRKTLFTVCLAMTLALPLHAHGGGGKGKGHEGEGQNARRRRHERTSDSALPILQVAGAIAGGILGAQVKSQGNYDSKARNKINDTTSEALEQSAVIDELLANDDIGEENWYELKTSMAESLDEEADTDDVEIQRAPTPRESTTSAGIGFNEPAARTRVQMELVERSVAKEGKTAGTSLSGAVPTIENYSDSASRPGQVVDLRSAAPAIFVATASPATRSEKAVAPVANEIRTQSGQGGGEAGKKYAFSPSPSRFSPRDLPTPPRALASISAGEPKDAGASLEGGKALVLAQNLVQNKPVGGAAKKARLPDPLKSLIRLVTHAGRAPMKQSRSIASLNATPRDEGAALALPDAVEPEPEESQDWNWTGVLALALFTAAALWLLRIRPRKSMVNLVVPRNGEHFTIRSGDQSGIFILDIKDVRGNLLRSAGLVRPSSVARAAVLPPSLAASLGAEGAFDRFELLPDGSFARTEKEEGYQVFPFVAKAR